MGRLVVRIQPGARRTAFVGWFGDLPKIAVAAPPIDGAANEAVIAVLSEAFDVRPRSVRLVGGTASRTKRFEIDGFDDEGIAAVLARLNPR